jgi:electron transfer flavoprotein alpha subunit
MKMTQDIFVLIEHLGSKVFDISYGLLAQARSLANTNGGKVKALLLGCDAVRLAADLAADEVLYWDHPSLAEFTAQSYQKVLAPLLASASPRLVLFGDTTIGGETAGGLSRRLGLPLVSLCLLLTAEGSAIKYTSQVCNGKILVEGTLPERTVLVAMLPGENRPEQGKSAQPAALTALPTPSMDGLRVKVRQVIEPDAGDVDISKEPLLISVGRGIQQKDNIELAQKLADALGAVVSGSRPIVDQGWLPTTRLVGKSGKAVKPKIYLALGISGAPEHMEALSGAEMIVAINTDPAAPIFNLAKYGATVDVLDLLPVLTEQVQKAKGG